MENGFDNQTGFDMYGEAPSGNHVNRMQNVRSESRRLIAGGNLRVTDSYTINQAIIPDPTTSFPVGTIIQGSNAGWDGPLLSGDG